MQWHSCALALMLARHARGLKPHPLLTDAAAVAFRKDAARSFASLMPRLQSALLANASKADDLAAGDALLRLMDKAQQRREDMTPAARRGYVRRVYQDRAFQVCEFFGAARRAGVELAPGRVASLGGGPGCCMLGYAVFERLEYASKRRGGVGAVSNVDTAPTTPRLAFDMAPTTPRLFVADYASSWAESVAALGVALDEPVSFMHCDLARPLDEDMRHLVSTLDVVLLSRTLSEVPELGWVPFVASLWAALPDAAILFVKDKAHIEDEVRRVLDPEFAWAVPGVRGVLLRKIVR